MNINNLIKILVICSMSADVTYAATGSLWGNVDTPVDSTLAPVSPKSSATKPTTGVTVASVSAFSAPDDVLLPPPVYQKTVCEVLAQKADLGNDVLNSSKMQNDLKNMAAIAKPEYVMILSDLAATKKLYQQFREAYLLENCKK